MEKGKPSITELFDWFVKSGSPPDELSHEFDENDYSYILLKWRNGTILYIPYDDKIYNELWKKFHKYWDKHI